MNTYNLKNYNNKFLVIIEFILFLVVNLIPLNDLNAESIVICRKELHNLNIAQEKLNKCKANSKCAQNNLNKFEKKYLAAYNVLLEKTNKGQCSDKLTQEDMDASVESVYHDGWCDKEEAQKRYWENKCSGFLTKKNNDRTACDKVNKADYILGLCYDNKSIKNIPSDLDPAKNSIVITLYMPKKDVYRKTKAIVFGPAFPKFKKARVTGSVIWETMFYHGYAKFQTVKLVLWQNGKPVRWRATKTDRFGGYSLEMPVNAKGSIGLRTFKKDLTRGLTTGYWPQGYYTTSGGNSAGKADPSMKKNLPIIKDWKKSFWDAASKLNAIMKDYEYQKFGGTGTPNVNQWTKNHKAGRDVSNALKLLIDLATGQATATAQVVENANITWKRLTGKPFPFVKSKGKVIKNAMKNGVGFFDYVKRLKKYTEAGQ